MRLDPLPSAPMRWILAACLAGATVASPVCAQDAQQPETEQPRQTSPAQAPDSQQQAPQQQAAQPQAGQRHDAQEEVEIDDHPRTFVVHLPQGYDSQQRYPVVILLHGQNQDADDMGRLTHFSQFAEKNSAIA